ncbi:MAG: YfhO family protein, partial [Oscillospiraceae bacterium]|nr:YfhO family protein [Oscillospiraceae bacterium]
MFWLGGILFTALPLFVEGTNLIWHGGSYIMFPVRFGFMLTFITIAAACYYTSKQDYDKPAASANSEKPSRKRRSLVGAAIAPVAALWAIYTFVPQIAGAAVEFAESGFRGYNIFGEDVFQRALVLSFVLFAVYGILFFINSSSRIAWATKLLIAAFVFLEVFCFSYVYVGYNNPPPAYNRTASAISQELELHSPESSRIRVAGNALNSNYGFIMRRGTLSNWTHTLPASRQAAFQRFGYSTIYTRTLDTGGTVFSDALFGVKNTLTTSPEPLSPLLYEQQGVSQGSGYRFYEHRYTLPFGIVAPSAAFDSISQNLDNHTSAAQSLFFSELVYRELFGNGGDSKLIEVIKFGSDTDDNVVYQHNLQNRELFMGIRVQGRQALYFAPARSDHGHISSFRVNSKPVYLPDQGNPTVTAFPRLYENGLVELGAFENED